MLSKLHKVHGLLERHQDRPIYIYSEKAGITSLTGVTSKEEFLAKYPGTRPYLKESFISGGAEMSAAEQYGIEYVRDAPEAEFVSGWESTDKKGYLRFYLL